MDKEKDTRNLIDEFKGMKNEDIVKILDERNHSLAIGLENTERDFNLGSIVRTANAFGIRNVYIIGKKQWNKRGAMVTNRYLHVKYYRELVEFIEEMRNQNRKIIAVDNVEGSVELNKTSLEENVVLVFGQEGPGISDELRKKADKIIAIEQFGSTRSINLGHAAAVAMYEWLRRNILEKEEIC